MGGWQTSGANISRRLMWVVVVGEAAARDSNQRRRITALEGEAIRLERTSELFVQAVLLSRWIAVPVMDVR